MKSFNYLVIALPWLLLSGGCSNRAPAPPPASPASLPADDLNRPVPFTKPITRLAVIGPGAVEMVYALGQGAALVGRDQECNYPPQVLKVPVTGTYTGPFPEKLIGVRPQLLVIQGETWDAGRLDRWQQQCGVPVAALLARSLPDVQRSMIKLGQWLGQENRARQLAAGLIPPRPQGPRRTAFIEISRAPLWTAGRNTLINDVMEAAGLTNVAATLQGYKMFSLEALLAANPDCYVISEKHPNISRMIGLLRGQSHLQGLKCIREGKVLDVPSDWVMRPGPRLRNSILELRRQIKLLF